MLSTEEVQQQIETWICEHRLPTFEEQFSIELELERQAEQAWMDSIPTLEEVEASCQEFVKRSSKWHNLVRAKNANILLHIVDFNYSEKNYRKLLDIPEFADEQYIPVRTPDDESLLAIDLDFSLKDLVKLNTANVFIKIAQTKKFTLETPHNVSIDQLHVKALTIKQFNHIYNPKSLITLQDFINLSANGEIYLGKVFAQNMIKFDSLNKITVSKLKARTCYLNSLSEIAVKKLIVMQLLKIQSDLVKLGTVRSLNKLKIYAKELLVESLFSLHLKIKASKILANVLEGKQSVEVEAEDLNAKVIKSGATIKLDCSKLEIEDFIANDCGLELGSNFVYTEHTFQQIQNQLNIIFKQSYIFTKNFYANQLQLIHLVLHQPLILNAELNILHELILESYGLQQNKIIKAGSAKFKITDAPFTNNAPIIVKSMTITADTLEQSPAGNIQSNYFKVEVINGDLKGYCKAKNLTFIAHNSLEYDVNKWTADNYNITIPKAQHAKFPSIVAEDYSLKILNSANKENLVIPKMHLGGQLNIMANNCYITIVQFGEIVAKLILINGKQIYLANNGLFGGNGITLNADDGINGVNDGTYIRTLHGDVKLISEQGKIDLECVEIIAMVSGNILLRARDIVRDISGKLQTGNGDVIVESPYFLIGINYHALPSESQGANCTRVSGIKVTSRPTELIARCLLLSGFNSGEHCVARLVGSICYLQELPQNREQIQCESVSDHENFRHTWTNQVIVGYKRRFLGRKKPRYDYQQCSRNDTTTHATYTAELVVSNNAHVNLTQGDHSGLVLAASQNTIIFDVGTVFNPTPQANVNINLNVGLEEVIRTPKGDFYTFMPNLSKEDFMVPELGDRYSFFVPLVNIPLEEKYPIIAGLNRNGKLQIMPRHSVWIYYHLGQELENFHLILHKQYSAALSIMPNPELLYWEACINGVTAIKALQSNYIGIIVSLEHLEKDLIKGNRYVVFYQEKLVPGTTSYAWFMRALMPIQMYQQLTNNFGTSGIYGGNILLCGVDNNARLQLRDTLKSQEQLEMQTGHIEFINNIVKVNDNITGKLESLTIDDSEVLAGANIQVEAESLKVTRKSAQKINLTAGNDIQLKANQYLGKGAHFKAGNNLITLFDTSENKAMPISFGEGATRHLLPCLQAGNAVVWQVKQHSIHEAPEITADSFIEEGALPIYLAVNDITRTTHQHTKKSGWGPWRKKRRVEEISIQVVSHGAKFNVKKLVKIVGYLGIKLQQVTTLSGQTILVAPDAQVELLAGCQVKQHQKQTHSSNLVWQKHQQESTLVQNYIPCQFHGEVNIVADSVYLEHVVKNEISAALLNQINRSFQGELEIKYLQNIYEYHYHKVQGPTAALAALIAIGIGALTMGAGTAILASVGAGASAGATAGATVGAAVGAGAVATTSIALTAGEIVAVMIDAALASSLTTFTLALAQNGGDIGKALRELGSSKNMRSLLTSIATAGLNTKFIEPLQQSKNISDGVLQVKKTVNLLGKVKRALMRAGITVTTSHLIERKENRTKLVGALAAEVTNAVCEHVDFGVADKQTTVKLSKIETKISKALIGGLGASLAQGKQAFAGGALGALVADLDLMHSDNLNSAEFKKNKKATEFLAGVAALLLRQDVNASAIAGGRVIENRNSARLSKGSNKIFDITEEQAIELEVANDLAAEQAFSEEVDLNLIYKELSEIFGKGLVDYKEFLKLIQDRKLLEQYGLIPHSGSKEYSSREISIAERILNLFLSTAYAKEKSSNDEATSNNTNLSQQSGGLFSADVYQPEECTWSVLKKAISGDYAAKQEMRNRWSTVAEFSDAFNKENEYRRYGALQFAVGLPEIILGLLARNRAAIVLGGG